jgi:hypothetical protein
MQRPLLAMLVVQAVSLAWLDPSHAAAATSPATDLVNGMPCNDPCKAYMAWTERMLARISPPRPQEHSEPRGAAHPGKPDRSARHAAAARRPALKSIAPRKRQSDAAAQSAEPRQIEIAPSQPIGLTSDQLIPTDRGLTEQHADAGSAAIASSQMMPASVADPLPAPQQLVTIDHAAGAMRLRISLALACCALLAFGSWRWITVRT